MLNYMDNKKISGNSWSPMETNYIPDIEDETKVKEQPED